MDSVFDVLLLVFLLLGIAAFYRLLRITWKRCPECGARLSFMVGPIGPITVQEVMQMDVLRLTNEERVLLTVAALTAHGRPAAIDGAVLFESSSPTVEIVRVSDTSAYAVAKGLGAARIAAAADADLGSGQEFITGLLDIEVLPAKAVSLGIQAGTPEAQPLEEEKASSPEASAPALDPEGNQASEGIPVPDAPAMATEV